MLTIFNYLPLPIENISSIQFTPPQNEEQETSPIIKDEIVY